MHDETTCLFCGEEFETPVSLSAHVAEVHGAEQDEDDMTALDWLIAIPVLLIAGWRYLFGAVVIVALVLGALGVFDKTPAPERKDCLGYGFVHTLHSRGEIAEFESVKPEGGWDCEYTLDDEDVEIRFKRGAGQEELEYEGYASSPAYGATESLVEERGFRE